VFTANVWWAVAAGSGIVLGAACLLWLYQRTMLGEVKNEKNRILPDLSFREWAVFVPLIALAFWIGIYPKPYFDVIEKPVLKIVQRVNPAALEKKTAPAHAAAVSPSDAPRTEGQGQ